MSKPPFVGWLSWDGASPRRVARDVRTSFHGASAIGKTSAATQGRVFRKKHGGNAPATSAQMPRCGEVALDTGSAPPLLHLRIKTTKQERGRQPVVFNRCATLGCAPYCFANPFREPCAYRFANAL